MPLVVLYQGQGLSGHKKESLAIHVRVPFYKGHSRSESSRGKLKLVEEVTITVERTMEKGKGAMMSKREEKFIMFCSSRVL